jgi:hypothetical protein
MRIKVGTVIGAIGPPIDPIFQRCELSGGPVNTCLGIEKIVPHCIQACHPKAGGLADNHRHGNAARGCMTEAIEIAVTINGRAHRLSVAPRRVLADVLREDLQLLGYKIGCDQAVCGACTVLVDEMPVTACTTFAFEVDRKTVITIEGLAEGGGLDPVPRFSRPSA